MSLAIFDKEEFDAGCVLFDGCIPTIHKKSAAKARRTSRMVFGFFYRDNHDRSLCIGGCASYSCMCTEIDLSYSVELDHHETIEFYNLQPSA
jgi:hypothetical protein